MPVISPLPPVGAEGPIKTDKIVNGTRAAKIVLLVTSALTITVVIVSFALATVQLERLGYISSSLEAATRSRGAANELMIGLLNLETGQRGFLITADPEYLEPYNSGLGTVWEKYSALRDSFAPLDAARDLDQVKELLLAKLNEMQNTILSRKSGAGEKAFQIVKSNSGKVLMDEIRSLLGDIIIVVQRRVSENEAEVKNMTFARRVTTYTSLALIGATLLFGFACFCIKDRRSETERLAELEALLERAESATRLKSAFVSTVSHELRTPMTGLSSVVDLLQKTHCSDDQKEMLGIMNSSVQVMLRLINDILLFSKMEAGRFSLLPRPMDFMRFLNLVGEPFVAVGNQKKVAFRVVTGTGLPSGILADSDRLRQVLVNLCDNALKFTPRGGHVELTVRRLEMGMDISGLVISQPKPAEPIVNPNLEGAPATLMPPLGNGSGDTKSNGAGPLKSETVELANRTATLEFTVADSGIGIPKEAQLSIFRPFTQAEASTGRRYGGTGLGLTISSQLVHLMGGRLTVDSEPGHGATFCFAITVPVVEPPRVGLHSPSLSSNKIPGTAHGPASQIIMSTPPVEKDPRSPDSGSPVVQPRALSSLISGSASDALHETTTVTSKLQLQNSKVTGFETHVQFGNASGSGAALPFVNEKHDKRDKHETEDSNSGSGTRASNSNSVSGTLHRPWSGGLIPITPKLPPPPALAPIATPKGVFDADASARATVTSPSAIDTKSDTPRAHKSKIGLTVLLVEDSEIVQKVMAKMLTQLGHTYVMAANGRQALDVLFERKQLFDAVDVHMPVMDGLTATRLIREHEQQMSFEMARNINLRVPVLALTAAVSEDEQQDCMKAQMDGVVTKPISLRELDRAMQRLPQRSVRLKNVL